MFPGRKQMKFIVLIVFMLASVYANAQQWQLVNPAFPTADAWVAAFSVSDIGATGDGVTDVTSIFQKGLDSLGKTGGGTLFVPGGKYVIKGSLLIPKGVTLRGEWQKPVKGQPVQGTILMAYIGKGDENAAPLMTLQSTAGVRDLAIWYPEQDPNNIVPYSPAILFGQTGYWGNDYCNADNITFVNAYSGLVISRVNGGGCPMLNGLYGTPLSRGIEIDNIADVGHIENIDFSPDYWSGSGLTGSPAVGGSHKSWIKNNGTGIVMRRNDWSYTSFVSIDGYKIGFYAGPSIASPGSVPNGQNYMFNISNCQTGILCDMINSVGIMFSHITTANCNRGIKIQGGTSAVSSIQIYASSINGNENAIFSDTSTLTNIIVEQSTVSGGNAMLNGGTFIASGNQFQNTSPQITLGNHSRGIITGNTYQNARSIVNNSQYISKIDDAPVTLAPLPQFPADYSDLTRNQKPARAAMYLATAAPFNAVPDGATDNTIAVQNALTQAGNDGGGVVFLPPGKYKFTGHLSIPSGVELKGASDNFSAPMGQGTTLEPYADKGNPSGTPFIIMASTSGIRGVTVNYPEQMASNIPNVPAYPYTIQARGNDVYIVNVAFRAVYDGIDLFTYKCDNHFINNLAGHIFDNAIRVGANSTGGIIAHTQFNSGDYANGAESKWGSWPNSPTNGTAASYSYNMANTDFLKLGNCSNEILYNDFVFGVRNGIVFMNDGGSGASGVSMGMGIDGAQTSLRFEALKSEGFDMVNSQIVALGPDTSYSYIETAPGFNAAVRMVNTDFWGGVGKSILSNGNGSLLLQNASFQNAGTVRFASINANESVSVKNSNIQYNNNMLLPGTENHLSAESGIMDINGIDTTKMPLYKNVLGASWTVSLDGALPRIGWRAWASVNSAASEVQKALDSVITTRWATNGPQYNGQVFGVDMINEYTIHSIVLDQSTSANDYPKGYEVYAGTDSSNFGAPVATGVGTKGMTLVTFPDTKARYIKVVQTGGNGTGGYWSVHEFYAFGTGTVVNTLPRAGWTAWTNVAVTKNAVLNALDSNLTTRWSTGGAQQPGQEYGVDMQTNHIVRSIVLNQTTASPNDYPRGYEVYVAADSSNWGAPVATGAGTQGSVTAITFPDVTGRFIKVVQTSAVSNYWSIYEFNVMGADAPVQMPVTFDKIKATPVSKRVLVEWNVGVEVNVGQYAVQRSTDGIHFETIGNITATGNTAYSYTDNNPLSGKAYYRVQSIDLDGAVLISGIVSVSLPDSDLNNVAVYPNPVKANYFNIKFAPVAGNTIYGVRLFNITGKEVYRSRLNTVAGKSEYTVELNNALPTGMYILKLTDEATGVSSDKKINIVR